MSEFLSSESETINWYVWLSVLLVLSQWEALAPRRALTTSLRRRWAGNFGLIAVGILLVWAIAPVLCVAFSRIVTANGWGLLPALDAPLWLNIAIGILALDLLRYLLHWAAHRNPILWRIHRVHHTDQDLDFTTSARFHPIELGLSTLLYLVAILVLGLHPITVLLAEALSLAVNTFNHGNVRLPDTVDRILRGVLVTPDMHRVHHSSIPEEFNANLGGLFAWWDRLFETYVAQPERGHDGMAIGLASHRDARYSTLWWMLAEPFLTSPACGSRTEESTSRVGRDADAET